MRLLFISNVFPNPLHPTKGTFNLDMVRALSEDHRVRVVSPIPWVDEWRARRAGREAFAGGRSAIVDGIEVYYPRSYYPPKVLRQHYGRFLWSSTRGTIHRLLQSHLPDAIMSYWVHPDGEVAVRTARTAGVPAVVMVGGSDVLLLASDPRRRRPIQRVLQAADAIVTVSRDLQSKILEYGIASDTVHVVRRGVDPTKFSRGDRSEARRRLAIPVDGRILVWVGRMVEVKGLDVLLDACARARAVGTLYHLYLIGDGPLRSSLEADARTRGLADVVSFVGSCPHDQLGDWYRAADWVVLPSRSEGVPNVLRESLACGTPFVASRVGGIPEIAEDSANRLVPPGDPVALAEALGQACRTNAALADREPEDLKGAAAALTRILRAVVSEKCRTPALSKALTTSHTSERRSI